VAFFFDPNFGHDSGNWYDFGIVCFRPARW
jgi:hypothetical protein